MQGRHLTIMSIWASVAAVRVHVEYIMQKPEHFHSTESAKFILLSISKPTPDAAPPGMSSIPSVLNIELKLSRLGGCRIPPGPPPPPPMSMPWPAVCASRSIKLSISVLLPVAGK